MEFKIIAPGGDNLQILHGLSPSFKGHLLPQHLATQVQADFGSIIFQNYQGDGFSIWYSNYNIINATTLTGRADIPVLELHIQMLNDFHSDWDGVGEQLLKSYQYNLTFTPFVHNKASFRGGKAYYTFDIHFTLPYLQKLTPHFPVLDRFLSLVEKKKPVNISGHDRFLTHEMIALVHQMLRCPYKNGAAAFFMEAKVIELLLMVLHECSNESLTPPIKLSPYDIEMLHQAKQLVVSDFENPPSLMQLAKKVGINDFKLKKGFKHLFGTTVFDYMNKVRMEKAKQLLLETDLPIEDIAMMTGFEFTSNFNKAFKKHFNCTAAYLRRQKGT